MLHFELTLILLLLLVYCYAFESLVVLLSIREGQWLSQDLSLLEIQQELSATISITFLVMLPAMMVRTHSNFLLVALPQIMIFRVITQLISVHLRSYEIWQAAGRRCE
jgi:hypothetical protein